MKYKNLVADAFAQKSNRDINVAISLIAGIAVGAALAVLFTPISGKDLRKGIAEKAEELGDESLNFYASWKEKVADKNQETENEQDNEEQSLAQDTQKKPKSDIKELIHQAHTNS